MAVVIVVQHSYMCSMNSSRLIVPGSTAMALFYSTCRLITFSKISYTAFKVQLSNTVPSTSFPPAPAKALQPPHAITVHIALESPDCLFSHQFSFKSWQQSHPVPVRVGRCLSLCWLQLETRVRPSRLPLRRELAQSSSRHLHAIQLSGPYSTTPLLTTHGSHRTMIPRQY